MLGGCAGVVISAVVRFMMRKASFSSVSPSVAERARARAVDKVMQGAEHGTPSAEKKPYAR